MNIHDGGADPKMASVGAMSKILVVDDDPGVVHTLARMLQAQGHEVLTAADGEAALLNVARVRPDAVLVDLRMPRMDGAAFLRQLRASEGSRRTPVAIITGDFSIADETALELQKLGSKLYFKPVWLEDLLHIVQHLLPDAGRRP
jgi:CheY-like chemotaxis protein